MAKHLQVYNLFYPRVFFLNTGVMSANFNLSGDLLFDNHSLKSSCNVVAVVSELNVSILGGIFPESVAFLELIVLISFSI